MINMYEQRVCMWAWNLAYMNIEIDGSSESMNYGMLAYKWLYNDDDDIMMMKMAMMI